jgi:hypothetical protein
METAFKNKVADYYRIFRYGKSPALAFAKKRTKLLCGLA